MSSGVQRKPICPRRNERELALASPAQAWLPPALSGVKGRTTGNCPHPHPRRPFSSFSRDFLWSRMSPERGMAGGAVDVAAVLYFEALRCTRCGFELAIRVGDHVACIGCGQYQDVRPAEPPADPHPREGPEPEPEPDRLILPEDRGLMNFISWSKRPSRISRSEPRRL